MTSPSARLALPVLLLSLALACRPTPDAPPPAPAEPPPPASTATEAPVAPVPPGAEPATVEPGAPGAAPSATPGTSRPQGQGARPVPPTRAPSSAARAGETLPAPAPTDGGRPAAATPAPPPVEVPVRMVSVPADTRLQLTLLTSVASDTSAVEDRVEARLANAVVVEGETVVPAGAKVGGVVSYVQASAKVKGRAALTVRFRTVTIGSRTYDITAEPVRRQAEGTKGKDARNIGIGAGAGAVIGGILGGRKGAGIGAAVGGAGGTGVVLATKGAEVRLPSGTAISTRLDAPLVVELQPERQ